MADKPTDAMGRDLDIVEKMIGHRLRQEDLRNILATLDDRDRIAFTEQLADLLRKTSALLEVARRVSDTLSLDELLPRMVALVSEILKAERCTIFVHDQETQELYSRVLQGEGISEIRFGSHLGIAGSVFTEGISVNIPDCYADPRFNREIDRRTGFRTRNMLCCPIRDGRNKVIGVAQVLNKHEGSFADEDIPLLESIASQAASAFVNAQLHQQIANARKDEAQLLEVTTAISRELQLLPLLRKIMETVTTILTADRSTLFLYDSRTKELWSQVAQGAGTAEIRFPCHLGIAGAVFTSKTTVNIPDAYKDSRFNQAFDKKTGYKTDTILCMPVLDKQGTAVGVIQVLNKKGGIFTATDEKRLTAFSSQAAIAIENAKLFEEVMSVKNYNESILQSMSNAVITLDARGTVVKANHAALRLLRREKCPETVEGQPVKEILIDQNPWLAQSIETVRKSGKQDIAVDAELALPRDEAYAGDRRRGAASVNLTVVPLTNSKNESIGCMLMIEDITSEKRLKGTMARYMPKQVADKLLSEGEAVLGGQIQKATVLFSDIRSFTTITERVGAQETVKMLNEYFSIMVDIILEGGGILDKYIGDAIMSVFGAPFPKPEDADNAVSAAVGMLRALQELNRQREAKGDDPIDIGIGLNSDDVLSGNIGSLKRMDYTVIGDGVNLASRLEGANKPYGTQILVSEMTVRELRRPFKLREVDRIRVKGKSQPVGVFEVLDHYDPSKRPELVELLGLYQRGLALYRSRAWADAAKVFAQAQRVSPRDGVSKLYVERCGYFQEHPPASDWDGVWTMKDK
jgi:adenylate cyclase